MVAHEETGNAQAEILLFHHPAVQVPPFQVARERVLGVATGTFGTNERNMASHLLLVQPLPLSLFAPGTK
jgi:hypothetical protein